ncbi:unnamed protein product [Peronospora destructor]|uniref:RRM domain-containing protein n=1 Tax=Peronospora destructor TaxID=86335 RepID=A0AAV0U4T9_9STRA|nr:unnamed protein product [Peronospora destructor]
MNAEELRFFREETTIVSKKRKNSDAGEKSNKVHKEENGDAAAVVNPQKALEIFIAGLPWSTTEEEVKEHFAGCGEVTAARIPLQNGRSSGTAFLTFSTAEGAEAALAMDGQDFGGRWMKIRTAEKKSMFDEKPEGCTSVFIGNLSWDVDENTIYETFGECGEILSCRLATDRETGEFRGFGHVDFATTEAVDEAVKLAGTFVVAAAVDLVVAVVVAAAAEPGFGGRGDGPPKRQPSSIQSFKGSKTTFD